MIALLIAAYLLGVFISIGYMLESDAISDVPVVIMIGILWPILLPIFFLVGIGSALYTWVHTDD